MPLKIIQSYLTELTPDFILLPLNTAICEEYLRTSQSFDQVPPCAVGEAVILPQSAATSPQLIFTTLPLWRDGRCGESKKLANCYRSALELTIKNPNQTVAIPLFSYGKFGYPKREALKIALDTIEAFLCEHASLTVDLVLSERQARIYKEILQTDYPVYSL